MCNKIGAEITLRPKQTCNLTSVILKPDDTWETIKKKVKIATVMGTIQSMYTDFPYLSEEWKKNCEEERLLGVSLSGQMDNELFSIPARTGNLKELGEKLKELKEYAIEVNTEYSKLLNINPSTAITCVKPEGNSSQMVNSSSGTHARYSKFYIRRVRINHKDPVFELIKDSGIPYFPEIGQTSDNASTFVVELPVKSPDNAVLRNDLTALQQLEYWLCIKKNWAEHSVSSTIYVEEDEWLEVGAWVYKNFDYITGLSFLPKSNHIYQLAPYEEINKEEYDKRISSLVPIPWEKLPRYETYDTSTGSREFSCVSGQCELL